MAKKKTAKSKSQERQEAVQAQNKKNINTDPEPIQNSGEARPPQISNSSPGIHTKWDPLGGYKESDNFSVLDKYKNDLHYDARGWMLEQESSIKAKDDLICFYCSFCIGCAHSILQLTRKLKEKTSNNIPSYDIRLGISCDLYTFSAVFQRFLEVSDANSNILDNWPKLRGSHCFWINKTSTLISSVIFCKEVLYLTYNWILRWIWSITGRPIDCEPVLEVIEKAIIEAGMMYSPKWTDKYGFELFIDYESFPGEGRLSFPEISMTEDELNSELERVLLELEHECYEAKEKENMMHSGDYGIDKNKPESGGTENINNQKLPQSRMIAYQSYLYATSKDPSLSDEDAYKWLKKADNKDEENHPYFDKDMPHYQTWARYVRGARKQYNTQKNKPRAGRKHGKSIANINQLDYQSSQQFD